MPTLFKLFGSCFRTLGFPELLKIMGVCMFRLRQDKKHKKDAFPRTLILLATAVVFTCRHEP